MFKKKNKGGGRCFKNQPQDWEMVENSSLLPAPPSFCPNISLKRLLTCCHSRVRPSRKKDGSSLLESGFTSDLGVIFHCLNFCSSPLYLLHL